MIDPILYWNDVALEANKVSHTDGKGEQTGPPRSARALAIVHLAMYDAFAGAKGNPADLPRYLPTLAAAPVDASPDAAVAAAAHATLSALFPSQRAFFDAKHAQAGLSGTVAALDGGNTFGLEVAQAILADRKNDPDASDAGYAASMARGSHRPDPDDPTPVFHAPFYGERSKHFAVTKKWDLLAPPRPGEAAYLAALREVRSKGITPELMGSLPSNLSKRSVNETVVGVFWAYDGASGLGTPPRLYNQIVRQVAVEKGNTPDLNARLFALVNVALADAGIRSWAEKYRHNLWRPVLGIREHDASMGPTGGNANTISTDCDPGWLPFGAPRTNGTGRNTTPQFPAYPSGHATFGAAALHMTRLFYGETTHGPDSHFPGMFVSDEHNGFNRDVRGTVRPRHVRKFPQGLWQMVKENSVSRVFLGVHWRFDGFVPTVSGEVDLSQNVGGVPLGINIAEDIFNGGRANGMQKSPV